MASETDPAAEDRLDDAVSDFAAWRKRSKSLGVAVSIVLGMVAAVPGFSVTTDIQDRMNNGVAFLFISITGALVACVLVMIIAAALSRRLVRAQTPAAVQKIAARHEIEPKKLTEIAELVA